MSDLFLDTRSTRERRILDLRTLGFQRMLVCGRYEYAQAQPPRELQSHPDWLVIVYLEKGFQLYEIAGEQVELRGNQLMRVFPGESYGTGKFPEHRGTLFWMILAVNPPPGPDGAWGMKQEAALELQERLLDRSTSRMENASPLIGEMFSRIFASEEPSTPLERATLRHQLVSILLETGRRHETEFRAAPLAAEVARRLALDPVSMPSAEELAGFAGLSVSAFYERFGKEAGMTPKEFAMRWKVNEAMKRLSAGAKVTVVAHELGFSSSQYFASVVKRHSGQTPGHWRK